jgi:hypothetical protein
MAFLRQCLLELRSGDPAWRDEPEVREHRHPPGVPLDAHGADGTALCEIAPTDANAMVWHAMEGRLS